MDAYAEHLAQLNDDRDVQASDDILNASGQLLVKKGSKISREIAERVTRFKLLKPLENSVAIEDELTSQTLQKKFDDFFHRDESLASLYEKFNNPEELKNCCDHFERFALLRQKLTVLASLMPNVFEQALFCAWLSIAITQRQFPKNQECKEMFIAAMCHDIGMVHISGKLLEKSEPLTTEEWKVIQSHPVIGYNIVKEIRGVKPVVARAILEHHENLDGTGYPRGCVGAMLSPEGQILNLLDSVNAIYNKRFKPAGRSIKDVIPILRMNQHSRFGEAGKQLILLLNELPDQPKPTISVDLATELIGTIRVRNSYVSRCVDICNDLSCKVGFNHENPTACSLQNAVIHITLSIAQSGLINDAFIRWLEQVEKERLTHAYEEIEEAFLMLQEIIYHIDKLIRQLKLCREKNLEPQWLEDLAVHTENLQSQDLPALHECLSNFWHYR